VKSGNSSHSIRKSNENRIEMIIVTERKTIDLKEYCHFAKEDDMMEITEWSNGEGVDVVINSSTDRGKIEFNLTFGEWDCLKAGMMYPTQGFPNKQVLDTSPEKQMTEETMPDGSKMFGKQIREIVRDEINQQNKPF
jgi:hypothetical protein